jgi:hypothetical protein
MNNKKDKKLQTPSRCILFYDFSKWKKRCGQKLAEIAFGLRFLGVRKTFKAYPLHLRDGLGGRLLVLVPEGWQESARNSEQDAMNY